MRWPLLIAPLVLCAGCPTGSEDILLLDERFEDGAATWAVDGSITTVPTIHSAEHGLEVLAPTTMTHAIAVGNQDDWSDGVWLEYTSNCPVEPELWAEPQGDGTLRAIASIETALEPGAFELVDANLPSGPNPVQLSALTLEFDEPVGGCVLDNLRLFQPANQYGY